MIPTTARQDAVALLTVAMNLPADEELRTLVDEFRDKDTSGEILLAVVTLCRSLCIGTATLVHVVDDQLTDAQAARLTDDDLLPVAMSIIRSYAATAARGSDNATSDDQRR